MTPAKCTLLKWEIGKHGSSCCDPSPAKAKTELRTLVIRPA